eukprot:1754799-Heterocapsa_arctica.AAC.1
MLTARAPEDGRRRPKRDYIIVLKETISKTTTIVCPFDLPVGEQKPSGGAPAVGGAGRRGWADSARRGLNP